MQNSSACIRDVFILIEDDRAIALVLELVQEPCAKALDQRSTAVKNIAT